MRRDKIRRALLHAKNIHRVNPYSNLRIDVVIVYLTFMDDPLRIQPWSQDRRNQTKPNRKHSRRRKKYKESRQKEKDCCCLAYLCISLTKCASEVRITF